MEGHSSSRTVLGSLRSATLGVVALATLIAAPALASAYCRTASCPDHVVGAQCLPATDSDCGVPLFWPTPCTGFTVQKDASASIDAKTVDGLAKLAFAAWTEADCGNGTHPKMRVDDLGEVTCNEQEYNPDLANSNTIMFRSDGWPYPAQNAIALTTVTYNLDTGEIRDADMELNSTDIDFSTGDGAVTFDLQSILTHEAGHFLGMAHSKVPDATMISDYPPMSTNLRTLDADDIAGICAIYPPGEVPDSCDSTPRNGLGDECKSPAGETDSGCSIAVWDGADGDGAAWDVKSSSPSSRGGVGALVMVLGLAVGRLRSRRRGAAKVTASKDFAPHEAGRLG